MVFFTPKHSHFIYQNNIFIPAKAPFNLLKGLIVCVILLVGSVGSVKAKTWVLTSIEQYTAIVFRADGTRGNIQAIKKTTYSINTNNEKPSTN